MLLAKKWVFTLLGFPVVASYPPVMSMVLLESCGFKPPVPLAI